MAQEAEEVQQNPAGAGGGQNESGICVHDAWEWLVSTGTEENGAARLHRASRIKAWR
jgi:hypothetical protein